MHLRRSWAVLFLALLSQSGFAQVVTDVPEAVIPASTMPSEAELPIIEADDSFVDFTNLESAPAGEKKAQADEAKKKADLQKAVKGAYKGVFYENNFSFIRNPLYDQYFPGDELKQLQVGDCLTVDIGGQYRARYHSENNFRGLGLTGRSDDFLLHRTRLFVNAKADDVFRVFVEYIDAESNYENFAPRAIEVNRSDLQNAFGEVFLSGCCDSCGRLSFRFGRQEMLLGSQRLISPLDWANTRRTFDGFNLVYRSDDWNVDAFYLQPVRVDPRRFDEPFPGQDFYGVYATYKGMKDQTFDAYALQYDNHTAPSNFEFTTIGGRWNGTRGDWLGEIEGGAQFGDNTDGTDHHAGFWTVGIGHKWDTCWKPTLWCYYDWASGGDVRGGRQGFDHLFPLGHKYLGFMDLFARSNIESPNVLLTFQPHEKWTVLCWYYYMFLENRRDTPYNLNMVPFNAANAPARSELGQEIDLMVTCAVNARVELLFGYSHFFAGDYYKQTPGVPFRNDANFFYTQFQWNF